MACIYGPTISFLWCSHMVLSNGQLHRNSRWKWAGTHMWISPQVQHLLYNPAQYHSHHIPLLGAITRGYHSLRSNPTPYTKPELLVGWGVRQYTWRQWWLRQEFHQCRGRRWWGSYREECWQSCSTHKSSPKDVTNELPFGVLCPRGWWDCCLHVHHSSEQVFC